MDECVFCKIAKGENFVERMYENDNFFSILDVNPMVKGHALVISKTHFSNVLELPTVCALDLLDCAKETAIKLMKNYNAGGFNLLSNNFEVAGQIVNHFHFHVLPRKKEMGKLSLFIDSFLFYD
jgi:histidine triad (HIT) family protein